MAAKKEKVSPRVSSLGFNTISVKLSKESFAQHFLYVKEHRVREVCQEKPQNRTLFVLNVPPYFDEVIVQKLFSSYGEVVNVHFHSKPTSSAPLKQASKYFLNHGLTIKGFKVAYVVFKHANDLKNLSKCREGSSLQTDEKLIESNSGIRKWTREYNDSIADPKELQKEIDEFMDKYDDSIEKEIEKAKETEGVPDDEGWITVTRHGKRPVIPRHEAVEKKISKKERKKRSQKELLNFYTFQIKQTKMEHIAQLRHKFEEDKKRIGIMKINRKFKPY